MLFSPCQASLTKKWRRGRDSNPRRAFALRRFQVVRVRPAPPPLQNWRKESRNFRLYQFHHPYFFTNHPRLNRQGLFHIFQSTRLGSFFVRSSIPSTIEDRCPAPTKNNPSVNKFVRQKS